MARSSPPFLYVIAGPNGSGKSTLAAQLRADIPGAPEIWINADEIAARLRDESSDKTDKTLAAAIEADRLRHAAYYNSQSEPDDSDKCLVAVYRDGRFRLRAEARGRKLGGWLAGLMR